MAGLGFSIAAAETSPIMPDSFVNEVLIHRRAENRIVEVYRANYLITKIENVNCCHDYRLALRTRTYEPLGPGTAPFTSITLSSVSISTISRLRTVTWA